MGGWAGQRVQCCHLPIGVGAREAGGGIAAGTGRIEGSPEVERWQCDSEHFSVFPVTILRGTCTVPRRGEGGRETK